jgi:hypothetical protein
MILWSWGGTYILCTPYTGICFFCSSSTVHTPRRHTYLHTVTYILAYSDIHTCIQWHTYLHTVTYKQQHYNNNAYNIEPRISELKVVETGKLSNLEFPNGKLLNLKFSEWKVVKPTKCRMESCRTSKLRMERCRNDKMPNVQLYVEQHFVETLNCRHDRLKA